MRTCSRADDTDPNEVPDYIICLVAEWNIDPIPK